MAFLDKEGSSLGEKLCFREWYCNECDCRRVLFTVYEEPLMDVCLATISYSWDLDAPGTRAVADTARAMGNPYLQPFSDQTRRVPEILDLVREHILGDAAHVARLKPHYAMFRKQVCRMDVPDAVEIPPSARQVQNGLPYSPHVALLLDYQWVRTRLRDIHTEALDRLARGAIRDSG